MRDEYPKGLKLRSGDADVVEFESDESSFGGEEESD